MKTIGLLGGMSWESSIEYYRIINQITREKLGGLHSAKSVMVSVDFAVIEELQSQDRWDEAARELIASSLQIQAAGADFLLIATNTMHKVFPQVQEALDIPVVHIADATAQKIRAAGLERVGLHSLPGIHDHARRMILLEQIVESIRRIDYVLVIRTRDPQ